MTRFLAVLLATLVLAPACGGQHERSSSETGTETEAAIQFKRPVALNVVLEMAHRRGVRPTQLVTRTLLVGETITAAVVVEPGMTDEEIETEFRISAEDFTVQPGSSLTATQRANLKELQRRFQDGPIMVNDMFATGDAEALQSLKEEPEVRSVFLKPSKPFGTDD